MVKFPKGSKIEACAARAVGRYAMHGVRVEADAATGARAVATDGRVLAIVPCELESGDALTVEGRIVPREAIQLARKVAGAKGQPSVTVGDEVRAAGQIVPPVTGEFRRYRTAIPAHVTAETHAVVTLDADRLRALLDALSHADAEDGIQRMTLAVPLNAGGPVVVAGPRQSLGVIMPMMREGGDFRDWVAGCVEWAHGGSAETPKPEAKPEPQGPVDARPIGSRVAPNVAPSGPVKDPAAPSKPEAPRDSIAPAPVVPIVAPVPAAPPAPPVQAPAAPMVEAPAPAKSQAASAQAPSVTGARIVPCGNCGRDVLLFDASDAALCPNCRKARTSSRLAAPAPMADPRDPPVATADPVSDVDVRENHERDGIELRFPCKPPAQVLAALKLAGWHWSKAGGCWYARRTDRAREFVRNLTGRAP